MIVSTMSATLIVQTSKPAKQRHGSSCRLLDPALLKLHRMSTAVKAPGLVAGGFFYWHLQEVWEGDRRGSNPRPSEPQCECL
jgi:hypothetical protein